jgi:hypothetical protein
MLSGSAAHTGHSRLAVPTTISIEAIQCITRRLSSLADHHGPAEMEGYFTNALIRRQLATISLRSLLSIMPTTNSRSSGSVS